MESYNKCLLNLTSYQVLVGLNLVCADSRHLVSPEDWKRKSCHADVPAEHVAGRSTDPNIPLKFNASFPDLASDWFNKNLQY